MAPANAALARLTRTRACAPLLSAPPLPTRPQCPVRATRAYAAIAPEVTERLPRIAQPSLWQNFVPKHFRSRNKRPFTWHEWRAKEWNPATIYIIFGLVIGSNAINTLILRRDIADFSRKANAKIALLREVLEKVQNGEDVDVEGILGTGRAESEAEWEQALKTIEEEDRALQSRKRRKASTAEAPEASKPIAPAESTPGDDSKDSMASVEHIVPQDQSGPVAFY